MTIKFKMHEDGSATVFFTTPDGERHEVEAAKSGQVFTHRDHNDVYHHFAVDVMFSVGVALLDHRMPGVKAVKTKPLLTVVQHMLKNAGIEQIRLDRLCKPYIDAPLIAIDWGDDVRKDGITIIDGNHRYIKKFSTSEEVLIMVFEPFMWNQFLVPLPTDPEFGSKYSGIVERERSNG